MGALSWLSFGSTAIAQKVLLAGGPILASVMLYRALARLTGHPGAAVLGAVSYGLSAMVLWSFSDGRIPLLVALCVLPVLFERLESAFGRGELPDGRWRFVAGVAVTLAVGIGFMPGVALAVGVLVVVQLVFGATRGRGLAIAAAAVAAAAVLLFPFVPTMISGGAAGLGSTIGTTDLGSLARLALGGGPGTWSIAAFLPVAAVLAFSLVGPEHRGVASRAVLSAAAGLALAWCSSAGYLPAWAANAPIYLALAGVGEALVVGLGLSSVLSGLGRESFGLRQIGTALLAAVLGAGILLQTAAVMVGGWAVGGPDALPPAWAVVSSSAKGEFRVIWLGADSEHLVRRARGRPGGRRAERRGVAPVRADRSRGHRRDGHGQDAHRFRRGLPARGAGRDGVGGDDARRCAARSARRAVRGRAGGRPPGGGGSRARRAGRSRS